jgi:hypothetical protein
MPLRQLHPQLAQVSVRFEFQDGSARAPSAQSFDYFPAARGFFRYACPCNGCSGEFDLSCHVADLASRAGPVPLSVRVSMPCTGQRARDVNTRVDCPISARVLVRASTHSTEEPTCPKTS